MCLSLDKLFTKVGVEALPGSDSFRRWCCQRYPKWGCLSEFLLAIPSGEWVPIKRDGIELCFLANEEVIKEMTVRSQNNELLPIGALADGSFLVIDTLISSRLQVGRVFRSRNWYSDG